MISKTTDLDMIRKNPSHYFNAGDATGPELMAMVIMAALKRRDVKWFLDNGWVWAS